MVFSPYPLSPPPPPLFCGYFLLRKPCSFHFHPTRTEAVEWVAAQDVTRLFLFEGLLSTLCDGFMPLCLLCFALGALVIRQNQKVASHVEHCLPQAHHHQEDSPNPCSLRIVVLGWCVRVALANVQVEGTF